MIPSFSYSPYLASVVCLAMFGLLGAFDGVYFHLIKFKLHQHKEALNEHLIHAFRGLVFGPIAYFFFIRNSAGALLWAGLGAVVVDLTAEVWDILIEKESRAKLGGISPPEGVVHVLATGFRMAALAFSLSAKPADAWSWASATQLSSELPMYMQAAGYLMLTSSVVGAWSHIALLRSEGGVWAAQRTVRQQAPRVPA